MGEAWGGRYTLLYSAVAVSRGRPNGAYEGWNSVTRISPIISCRTKDFPDEYSGNREGDDGDRR
jgi:hypothetical protein